MKKVKKYTAQECLEEIEKMKALKKTILNLMINRLHMN